MGKHSLRAVNWDNADECSFHSAEIISHLHSTMRTTMRTVTQLLLPRNEGMP